MDSTKVERSNFILGLAQRFRRQGPSGARAAVRVIWLLPVLACLSATGNAQELPPPDGPALISRIVEIRFAGNKTTQPRILLQEMTVRVGDLADPVKIEKSRQAIMDLGLFKSVKTELLPGPNGVILLITISEKYYILPIPKLNRDADNNFSLGAQLRVDNLAGLNQQLKVTYEAEDTDNSDGTIKTSSLDYVYPRIDGTPYQLDLNISRSRIPNESMDVSGTTQYDLVASLAKFEVSRWFKDEGPSLGWRAGLGLVWQKQAHIVFMGTPDPEGEGRAVGLTVVAEHSNVHDYLYSRTGKVYGYNAVYGMQFLGSDTNYTRHLFYYRNFLPVSDKPHQNLNVQLQLGLSSDPLFNTDTYALGGSRSLRGYPSGGITGNAFVLANVEYLAPLFNYYPLRGSVFMDVGNAYPSNRSIDFSGLKTGVGVGLRLKLKSFVKIDLRLDYAYNLDTGETKVYGGTKEAF